MKYFKHILFPITLYVLCSNVFAYQYHSIFNNRTDSDIKLTYIKCNHDYDYTKNKSIFTCLPEKKILVIKAMNFIKDPFEPFIEPQDGNNWESYYAISIESTNIGKIDFLDPVLSYSAGQFCKDALREINDIVAHDRTPILVGGTMLYFRQLLFGLSHLPAADKTIREKLEKDTEKLGLTAMHDRLKKIDPEAAFKIKPQDPQRIQRALEVFEITGTPISQLQKNNQAALLDDYHVINIALIPEDRAWLHDRIEKRFKKMLENGLIDEVKALHARADLHLDLPSMRIVGYRQVWEYLDGAVDFETMMQKALAATRQLAKRQFTWLRGWPDLQVFDPSKSNSFNFNMITGTWDLGPK